METLSLDSSRSTRPLVDHIFDLDLALTMVNNSSTEQAPATVESSGGDGGKVTGSMESPTQEKSSPSEPAMVDAKFPVGVCTVCMEAFQPDTAAKQVPTCGHVYHGTCIAKWLSLHNSCPLCRCTISGHRKSSVLSV